MANSFLNQLTRLDVRSVTNASSLFFYLANNGNSRVISAKDLQSKIGVPIGFVSVLSAPYAASSGSPVAWDGVRWDTYSMWNVSTPSRADITFNGMVEVKFIMQAYSTAQVISEIDLAHQVWKNGGILQYSSKRIYTGGNSQGSGRATYSMTTGPFSVQVGDYIETSMIHRSFSVATLMPLGTKMWVRPLKFF